MGRQLRIDYANMDSQDAVTTFDDTVSYWLLTLPSDYVLERGLGNRHNHTKERECVMLYEVRVEDQSDQSIVTISRRSILL